MTSKNSLLTVLETEDVYLVTGSGAKYVAFEAASEVNALAKALKLLKNFP